MKKIILLLVIGYWLLGGLKYIALAQTKDSTDSAKPTITNFSEQKIIKNLKEKVASKVKELMKKNNKAIVGKVVNISENLIKIKDLEGKEQEVKTDETLTKFYKITGSFQKEIKLSDIEKNDYLIISGIVNDNKTIEANAIFVDQPFLVGSGKVMEIDKENYILKVISSDKTVYNISIETFTKQQILNIKTLEIEKTGFSKIIVGDRIHFVCEIKGDEKDNTYQAKKTLIIPQEYFIK